MPGPVACTIVSNNYIPYARVLARSFLGHHLDGSVWVCLVDRPSSRIDYGAEPFHVVPAEELGIPSFENFAFRYSILELNTAVKPYFLERVGELSGCSSLCYFDPDILITAELTPVYEALESADLVLTPHILRPIDDDRSPSELDFLLSGVYNLGFVGLRFNVDTRALLAWWQRRLYRYCEHRVERGLFVDQRWMDLAPAFVGGARILRDPGLNVAYWNLMHRPIERDADGWLADGSRLRFFHFSGFHPDRPSLVSKFQNRLTFESRPDLRELFEEYSQMLRHAGLDDLGRLEYAYGSFDNGVKIPIYAREVLKLLDSEGLRWPDPFATGSEDSLFDWLIEPIPAAEGVLLPRLALVMWDLRGDLQQAFPSPLGGDGFRYQDWYEREVRTSPDLDAAFAPRPAATSPPGAADHDGPVAMVPASLARWVGPEGLRIDRRDARWLTAEAAFDRRRRPRVPRLAMMLLRQRSDLRSAFPDPLGRNRADLALWYVTFGRHEYRLPASLCRSTLRSLPPRQRLYAHVWRLRRTAARRLRRYLGRGHAAAPRLELAPPPARESPPIRPAADQDVAMNVVGWVNSPTGVGEVCRATLEALRAESIRFRVWPLRHPALEAEGPTLVEQNPGMPHPITLFHVNADMMAWVQGRMPLRTSCGYFRIGYWFWELAHFPLCFADSFRYVDALWAPSRFCQQAFAALAPVEVRWVPPAARRPEGPAVSRSKLGIDDDRFLFFFAFDPLSVPERKNPFGLLDAFSRAVETSDRPLHLLLKLTEGADSELAQRLEQQSRGLPVTLIQRSTSRHEISGLMAACDAYVSLHRSEGLGLPLIEAMYLGKPVIATGYGGCTDFLDETTGWPVALDLVRLDRNYGPYPTGTVWADPDPAHAAELMVEVASEPEEAAERARAARERVESVYAPEVAGRRFRHEVERILGS